MFLKCSNILYTQAMKKLPVPEQHCLPMWRHAPALVLLDKEVMGQDNWCLPQALVLLGQYFTLYLSSRFKAESYKSSWDWESSVLATGQTSMGQDGVGHGREDSTAIPL